MVRCVGTKSKRMHAVIATGIIVSTAVAKVPECGPDIWTNFTTCPSVTASVNVFSSNIAAPAPYSYRIPALIWAGNHTPDLLAFIEARYHHWHCAASCMLRSSVLDYTAAPSTARVP